ncbi:ABC transporter ATP-binding protein [Rhodococcus triatomae]|uniref:ATP-binding cassette, subfamily C n=1 Tax=Rhodococcus triatomae TaxID=300028 RepID=A0A1G8L4I4_9NOCA|nr:ABC transporter ATP-binding protein [Rhodococcus triatomae]QNG20504.1 ABC transporter ATP-binding protein [Rhodococcus triatomae]QNG23578.1 ABC transporter ATP-binding protein [Rhodococcus triatomae]SDI50582.1 ATP-binding cassette, subfamily C [Rhodococcus triatomae]
MTATTGPGAGTGDASSRPLLPVATARRCSRWLLEALRGRPLTTTATLLAATGAAAATVVPLYMFGRLIDEIRAGAGGATVATFVAVIAVAAVVAGLLTGVSSYLIEVLGGSLLARLREQVVARTLRLPLGTVEKAGKGDVLSRVGDDISVIDKSVGEVVPSIVSAALLVAASLVAMAGIDWRLAIAGSLAIPVYVLALRWYLPRSAPLYAEQRVAMGARSQALIGSIQGRRTVRAYGLEESHLREIDRASDRAKLLGITVFSLFTRFAGRGNRAEFVGLALILVTGFALHSNGAITVGAATAAALVFHRLFNPIGLLLYTFDEVQSAGASLARIVGVIDIPDPPRATNAAVPEDSSLELADIRHSYDGREVLHGVTLRLEPGETVALVGATGAGKSTLASLAAGVHVPDSGSVRIGGVDIAGFGDTVRRRVAVVSQEVHVFSGSLIEDLRLAAPDADETRVRRALTRVGAQEWVEHLPDGIDTQVGEGGHELTTAQAQQLALARILLVDPDVVVLDEATAEAGSRGARELEFAAAAVTNGRTALVVAHRLTQAERADRVVVLGHGRILEEGTHDALVAAGGGYARLWAAW